MESDTLQQLTELARKEPLQANGRHYVPNGYSEVAARCFPKLVVHTLTALVEYLLTDVDGLDEEPAPFVHVESPASVRVLMPVDHTALNRHAVLEAVYESPIGNRGLVENFVALEGALIQLQTFFADAEDRAQVLKLLGNVKDEGVRTQSDDGVSQTVTARKGVAVVDEVPVPRVVTLRPYRTFPDLEEQPASPFTLRLRSGPSGIEAGLFAADNGLWKLEAISAIGAWLAERLDDSGHVIIA